jgi:hypothetical protein
MKKIEFCSSSRGMCGCGWNGAMAEIFVHHQEFFLYISLS